MTTKQFESVTAKLVLNRVKVERMPFDWSLNPYRGCAHGCSFCYARAFQTFLGKEATDEFQHHIFIKDNAAEALESQLRTFGRRHGLRDSDVGPRIGPVAVGTATDPYQPIEAKSRQTRRCLQVLARYRVPTSVTTRSPLVLRDLDILRDVDVTSINISVNTLDAAVARKLEPASPHPAGRMRAVRALADAGFPVGIFAAPILPLLTDGEETLDALFAEAKARGAGFAMTSLLRLSPDVKMWYYHTLETHFPELIQPYTRLYQNAYVERSYADKMKRRIEAVSARHGLPEPAPVRRPPAAAPSNARPQPEQLSFAF
ncbi:radical SAM protein [Paenibacillus sp.]|uniref:SPL family radical SAM protein n=1 Tax=Paenibacillus sp. TaxID=58172 RepID=UPI0028127E16|nr:radical SAM protein [Paenibacillus sp.]